jgi:uncharacterized protein (UPF0332 family)
MTVAEEIEYRRDKEREAVRLAAKYVKTENYDDAASCYRAAAFHRAIRLHLEQRKRR